MKKIVRVGALFLLTTSIISASHKIDTNELNSVIEASITGRLVLADDEKGFCRNYRNDQVIQVTSEQLRACAFEMNKRLKNIRRPVTVVEKLSLFGKRKECKDTCIMDTFSEATVLGYQLTRMHYFLSPLINGGNKKALIKEIAHYKRDNEKHCEQLFPGRSPRKIAEQLLLWHEIIATRINTKEENYYTKVNYCMALISELPLKSIYQELSYLQDPKKKNKSYLHLPAAESW